MISLCLKTAYCIFFIPLILSALFYESIVLLSFWPFMKIILFNLEDQDSWIQTSCCLACQVVASRFEHPSITKTPFFGGDPCHLTRLYFFISCLQYHIFWLVDERDYNVNKWKKLTKKNVVKIHFWKKKNMYV